MQRQQDLEDRFTVMQEATYSVQEYVRIDPDTGKIIILTEDEL